MKKYLRPTIIALAITAVAIQFFPINKENPVEPAENDFLWQMGDGAQDEMSSLLKRACYDCHSNNTRYPWYTRIQPVGWWIKGHVRNARDELNFSSWLSYSDRRKQHKMEECFELVEKGQMPLKSYTWAHPEARLTKPEREKMTNWFKSLAAE